MELGKLREHMLLYHDTMGTEIGFIDAYENGLKASIEGQTFIVPLDYVESITPEKDMALGKVQVHIVFYELMGIRHEDRFIMSGVQLPALQKMCGKG